MNKVLLHVCCANCATVCINKLREEKFEVFGLFYNPNIQPDQEYFKRKQDIGLITEKFDFPFIEVRYDPEKWFDVIRGHEADKEGKTRCELCFKMRLEKTYEVALREGFDFFSTTLTISPHKNSEVINKIGNQVGNDKFLRKNFKKENGFEESIKISKQMSFYRQHYCGCIFSKEAANCC